MSIEEKRRAAFEAAFPKPDGFVWNSMDGQYWEGWSEMGSERDEEISAYNERWNIWNSALESVLIDLPDAYDKYGSGEFVYWADDVDHAITSIGLRIKS